MADCKNYIDMISAYVDGELSERQEALLAAHMEHCPDCQRVYDAFSSMSAAIPGELLTPPASLAEGVMLKINTQEEARKKGKKIHVMRYLAACACFALVVFGAWRLGFFDEATTGGDVLENITTYSGNERSALPEDELDLEFNIDIPEPSADPSNSAEKSEDGDGNELTSGGVTLFGELRDALNKDFASNSDFVTCELNRLSKAEKISVYAGKFVPGDGEYANSAASLEALDEKSRSKLFEMMTAAMLLEYSDAAEGLEPLCTLLFTGVKTDSPAGEVIAVTVCIYSDQLFFKIGGETPILFMSDTFPIDFEGFIDGLIK